MPGRAADIRLRNGQHHLQLTVQARLHQLHGRFGHHRRLQRLLSLPVQVAAQEGETLDASVPVRKEVQVDHRRQERHQPQAQSDFRA